MDLIVRPARASDIPCMCDLLFELFSIETDFTPAREKQSRGLELLVSDYSGSSAVFVAEKDSENYRDGVRPGIDFDGGRRACRPD